MNASEDQNPPEDERNRLLAQAVRTSLSPDAVNKSLALSARRYLSIKEIEEAVGDVKTKKLDIPQEAIDELLTLAVQEALSDIEKRDYRKLAGEDARKVDVLGMAFYGDCTNVKAVFGPVGLKAKPKPEAKPEAKPKAKPKPKPGVKPKAEDKPGVSRRPAD